MTKFSFDSESLFSLESLFKTSCFGCSSIYVIIKVSGAIVSGALAASPAADSATAATTGSSFDSGMGSISYFCFFCYGSGAFSGYTFLLRPTFFFSFGSFYYFGGFRDFGSALTFLGFGG